MELVVLMGLQGAGKTSFYRARFAATHAHVSKDLWPNARRPAARQARELQAALGGGRPAVVDNTHPTRADRREVIALARAHGVRVVGYWLESVLDDCLRRNAQREGRGRVPDVALLATCKRLELPGLEEGFDALFHVALGAAGEFHVTPWEGPR